MRRALVLTLAIAGAVFARPAPAETAVAWETIAEQGFEIVVRKADRKLDVLSPPGGEVVRSWRIGLGFDPVGDKEREGDGRTPEGTFRITKRVPHSSYYKAFLINYPLSEDAERGVKDGIITEATRTKIDDAHANKTTPPQFTGLGGLIEIHGMGSLGDWTLGCVAVDNDVIDELWPHTKTGTVVRIVP